MQNRLSYFSFLLVLCLIITSCANRGNPTGGEKDTTPPVIIKSTPENFTTNFDGKEIEIYFDEYIKVKDLQKNLIISPPMDTQPDVTPLGAASKSITIKINDTLLPNTTYAFNFGESIVDNNEENPYPYYRYVFSTGSYIDSLKVNGNISDALNRSADEFVSVMLYEIDSTFTDSTIYKRKPKYITNTLDSTSTFQLENLKAGNYALIALKDENNNYTFQQKTDKIGFVEEIITVPSENSYNIKLFKENIDFKATRPKLVSGQKIAFGYEGSHESMIIKLLSQKPTDFTSVITKDQKSDSLNYWYKPKIETDSLVFEISNVNYKDTLTVRIKDQLKDSLVVKPVQAGTLSFINDYELEGNVPFASFDKSKMTLIDKDSIDVNFTTALDTLNNKYAFIFDKTESNSYRLQMFPGALTDFFGQENDTLNYSLKTKSFSDYGNVRLTLQNAKYPVIVQLVNAKNEIQREVYSTKQELLDFRHIPSGTYYLRVVFDVNGNGKYDTGNYLQKIQPERVSYYPEPLDIRSGWDWIEEFILLD